MSEDKQFDFWYAVNNTKLITSPTSKLETFGDTIVNYTLLCENMDNVNKICIREGQIKALKPSIITPDILGEIDLNDFGYEAEKYAGWLKENANDLRILQYGFSIYKKEIKEYFVTDKLDIVLERVKKEIEKKDDPLSSIIIGVDNPWEVCLLKLMVELVQKSAEGNFNQLNKKNNDRKKSIYEQIDNEFVLASKNPAKIKKLAQLLRKKGLWDQYEDRFFALVRATQQSGG